MASAGRQSQRRKGSVTPPDLYGHMRTPDSLSGDASGSDVTVFAPGDVGGHQHRDVAGLEVGHELSAQ